MCQLQFEYLSLQAERQLVIASTAKQSKTKIATVATLPRDDTSTLLTVIPKEYNLKMMPQSRNLLILITALILVTVAVAGLRLFNSKYAIELNSPLKKTIQITPITPTPKPTNQNNKELTFQGCDIKKEGNPLVSNIWNLKGNVVGTLRGNINKIGSTKATETASPSAALEVISPKGDQTYLAIAPIEKGMFYDAVKMKEINFKDLHLGQTVVVSFNCFPTQNNLFKIAQVAITSKE
jgi:hypothetical protein